MADAGDRNEPSGALGWLKWALTTDKGAVAYVRDIVGSALVVLLIGGLLFGVSGVWPPMVAIESGSMEPHIQKGDLVFVMEEHKFTGDNAITDGGQSTGITTYTLGTKTGHKTFGAYGDVIVYQPDGENGDTPIIHRARFWVTEGENWYDKANKEYLAGADNCNELEYCPAPHSGFITKGDHNGQYDQVGNAISSPVKPSWIIGTAEFRIPYLGYIRLVAGTISGVGLSGVGLSGVGLGVAPSVAGAALLGGAVIVNRE